ncbi:MAG: VWA domain-containing protein, partial [Pyrinomonadaceae bacterium]
MNLNVRVIDRSNRPIANLIKNDFQVFENNIPQPIEFFSTEEVPIQYGLVIDNSASLRGQIDKVIEAGKIIISNNKPEDETFLERFVDKDNIETMQDFTSSKRQLIDSIDDMYVQGGQTALIDAIYLAAEHIASYKKGNLSDRRRRAMVLVTDGEDRQSFYKVEQLFAGLREQDVQIFIIGFVKDLDSDGGFIRKSPREKAVKLLENLAAQTGGRVFLPASLSELPQIANEITRDMRTQYVIGYNPTNKARDGSYRAIKITLADSGSEKRIALTRPGYTAPLGEGPVR